MVGFSKLSAAASCFKLHMRGGSSSAASKCLAAVPLAKPGIPMTGSSPDSCLMPSSYHVFPARACRWRGTLGHRTLSSSCSAAAEEEKGKLKVLESMALALETSHGRQGRCDKVELPSDQGDLLGVWQLRVALDGENLLRFQVFLESSLNMKVGVGFSGELTQGMTMQQKLEWVNTWNRNKKWTKCFVDSDGDIVLKYDLDLEKLSEPRALAIQEAVRMFESSLRQAAIELCVPELHELMPEVDKLMQKLKTAFERRSSV